MNQSADEPYNELDLGKLQSNIDRFIERQLSKAGEIEQAGTRPNLPIDALIKESQPLSERAVQIFFEKEQEYMVPEEVVSEVRRVFASMRNRLNSYAPKKRFYILETMDFFSSKISIGKLVPALMLLDGMDQKKAIAEFVKPTFLSINKNVEILASTNEIFNAKSIHLDRGSLYTFVSDIARVLLGLFKRSYLDSFDEINSHVELMLRILKENPVFRGNPKPTDNLQMQEDPSEIRKVVLEFVATIQAHEALYNYSLKRHAYYKLFLARLTAGRRFGGVPPFEVSRVFAGCLLTNDQLVPPQELVEGLLDAERFNSAEVLQQRREFVDHLSPSTVYKLIGDIKQSLTVLAQSNFSKEFGQVARMGVKNILKKVWTAFIELGEKGFELMTEPFKVIFQSIKNTYKAFIAEEKGGDGPAPAAAEAAPKVAGGKDALIEKNPEAIEAISQFRLVKTDVVAFRGEFDGASQKDYGYNARLFKQDELAMMRFHHAFERLFHALEKEEALYVIRFQTAHKIREYYAAFQFADHLVCLGLTHQKHMSINQVQQKDIFPYVLLFTGAPDKAFGRILSRKAEEKDGFYNEESLTANNAKVYYEAVYILLHLLPQKDWNSLDAQASIRFLSEELAKAKEGKGLIYLKSVPQLP
ncbi:MAG: hypothetical protein RRB13_15440 [bacterium]|nr:hypothetical protein [bacterium]